jgi:vancomycin resistance protein YoaR
MSTRVQHGSSPQESPPTRAWLPRLTLIVVTTLILSNLVAALMIAAYQIYYDGLIYPGVSVWDVDLSGMSPADAATALGGQFAYPQNAVITFRDGNQTWSLTAAELGVHFDVERTVQAAYGVGRSSLVPGLGQQATAWRRGIVVSPVIVFDQIAANTYLRQVAAQIDRPVVDATVRVEGLEAVTTPSQIGREVDIPATIDALGALVTTLESGEVEVAVVETPPLVVSTEEVAAQIDAILADKLEVYIEDAYPDDPGPWLASREALADMLLLELIPSEDGQTAAYDIRLNEDQLRAFLEPRALELERAPVNARFDFDESTGTLAVLSDSQPGRELDIPATIQLINQMTVGGEHRVPLAFKTSDPAIPDTATAEELGIKEMVASATTYYYGSSNARRTNIATSASRFHGLVIEPGQEFSFNHYLGEVTGETGYEESMIIYNGRTIRGVGGGVCQVSTTAFQAAFYAGFPITERHPHGYWVGYYDSGEGKGLDATVYAPLVDLKFINDLSRHLLIETSTNAANSTLTFRFYSTGDGRTVQKDGPYISNRVPHGPPLYEENPELASGQVKQVEYAIDGFDATVERIVYRDGQIILQDTFFSRYVPWQAVFQVAPGEIPGGEATTEE